MSHYNPGLTISGQMGDEDPEALADAFWNALAEGGYVARWDWSEPDRDNDIDVYTRLPTYLGFCPNGRIVPSPEWELFSPVISDTGLPWENSDAEEEATEVSEELMEIDGEDLTQGTADIVPDNVSEIFFSEEESQVDIEDNETVSITTESAEVEPAMASLTMEVLSQQPAVENNTLLVTASQANATTNVNNTRMTVQEAAEAIVAIIRSSRIVPPSVRSPLLESLNVDEPAPMAPMAQEQQVPGLLTITQPPGPVLSGDIQTLLGPATEKQDEESGMDSSSPSFSMDYQNQSSKKRKAETQFSTAHVLKAAKLSVPETEDAASSLPSNNSMHSVSAHTHGYNLKPRPSLTLMRQSVTKSRPSARNISTRESIPIADNSLAISRPRFRCIVFGCDKNYSSKNSVRRHVRQHHREAQWDPEAVKGV
ncbi:hypothetical protein RUND412_011030 [Rhizina undulata]